MSANLSTAFTDESLRRSVESRLLAGVRHNPATGCWEWLGTREAGWYGDMSVPGCGRVRTHRLSYLLFCGPFPDDLFVCHKCDNPPCVNPAHLFLGTHGDNMRDAARKGRYGARRGESAPKCKITEADVLRIRESFAAGVPRADIAAEFGLDDTSITSIATGRVWKHLPGAQPARDSTKLDCSRLAEAVQLRAARLTYATIGKRLGVKAMTVIRFLARHGFVEESCHLTFKGGPVPRPVSKHRAKLTAADVVRMRERYAAGESSVRLAAEYGVTLPAAHQAITGRTYSELPGAVPARDRKGVFQMSAEQIAEARRLRGEGLSFQRIGERLGLVPQSVHRVLASIAKGRQ